MGSNWHGIQQVVALLALLLFSNHTHVATYGVFTQEGLLLVTRKPYLEGRLKVHKEGEKEGTILIRT